MNKAKIQVLTIQWEEDNTEIKVVFEEILVMERKIRVSLHKEEGFVQLHRTGVISHLLLLHKILKWELLHFPLNLISNRNTFKKSVLADIMCQICLKKGHTAPRCYNIFNENFRTADLKSALAAMQVTDRNTVERIPDSGATSHVYGDASVFTHS